MALSASTLGASIKSILVATFPTANDAGGQSGDAWLTAFSNAIATAVVNHITSSAVVSVVTSCSAGPGSGSGNVT